MAPMAAEDEQKTEDMPSGGMQQAGAIREEELRCHMASSYSIPRRISLLSTLATAGANSRFAAPRGAGRRAPSHRSLARPMHPLAPGRRPTSEHTVV